MTDHVHKAEGASVDRRVINAMHMLGKKRDRNLRSDGDCDVDIDIHLSMERIEMFTIR